MKHGDRYFHRNSLVPFVVGGEPESSLIMLKLVAISEYVFVNVDAEQLAANFVRDEPVTGDLLKRLGWFNTNCDSEHGVSWDFPLDPDIDSRLVFDVAANVVTRAFVELHGRTGRSLGARQIQAPTTLRELHAVLRLFQVPAY